MYKPKKETAAGYWVFWPNMFKKKARIRRVIKELREAHPTFDFLVMR